MLSVSLQLGIPGTQELFIILFVMLFLAIPVGIAVLVVVFLLRRNSGDDERIEELEQEVKRLRNERETPVEKSDDQRE